MRTAAPLTQRIDMTENASMADERRPDATELDKSLQNDAECSAEAEPISERETLPDVPSQRQPSWKPVPPRVLALSERKD